VDRAVLEFSRDGHRQIITIKSGLFTLGRASSNDLGFPGDGTLSRRHAVIEQRADGWLIRDLNTANGTSVNGQKVSGPQILRSGDSIVLGRTQLDFRIARPEQSLATTAPSRGYFDITEEWERVTTPPVPTQPVGPAQDGLARQRLQEPAPGPGQTSPDDAERQPVSIPGMRTSGPEGPDGHGKVRGTARDVQVRQTPNGPSILSFRMERYDIVGNRLPPVGAELIGFRSGRLSDGEEVEVSGRWSHGTLHATKVINLSTGAQVRGTDIRPIRVVRMLILAFFAVALIVFITFFIHTVKAVGGP
jgi:pSer/pThr/pTyr-binding forkhead associated (FHA) protein